MNRLMKIRLTEEQQFDVLDIPEFLGCLSVLRDTGKLWKKSKKISYLNMPICFDIETSSFYQNGEKQACVYLWSLNVSGLVVLGRTMQEFAELLSHVSGTLQLSDEKRIVVYVHNLGYEFQFFRLWLPITDVFALEERRPVHIQTAFGVDFKCSFALSGYSLANLGNQLTVYKCSKMSGAVDYSKIRHSKTALTDTEILYNIIDTQTVVCYIAEKIEADKGIQKIPLTKTGYVRRYIRTACLYPKNKKERYKLFKYRSLMSQLTLTPDEYRQAKRAFQGGFTHANAYNARKVFQDVESYDEASAYPAMMVAKKFPMSRGEDVDIINEKHFLYLLNTYCCLFDIRFTDLCIKTQIDTPLSLSKCRNVVNPIIDNGRIYSADSVDTTMTEQDFFTMQRFYNWSSITIVNFRKYIKAYLPTDFVDAILTLYEDKTQLKGVSGKEAEYMKSKEAINSAFGMCVTDICRDVVEYAGEWSSSRGDIEKSIDDYNTDKRRFLSYLWGVWVTAYARRALFQAIDAVGCDYIYADTDSVKFCNGDAHKAYFADYNAKITAEVNAAMAYHKFNPERASPKTIKGKLKPLGVFEQEERVDEFKTLGAKRYLCRYGDKLKITVAGVNKEQAAEYLSRQKNAFAAFDDCLQIPPESSGKNTHTYIDAECSGVVIDYLGVPGEYYEKTFIHLEPVGYNLSMSDTYIDFLCNTQTKEL